MRNEWQRDMLIPRDHIVRNQNRDEIMEEVHIVVHRMDMDGDHRMKMEHRNNVEWSDYVIWETRVL